MGGVKGPDLLHLLPMQQDTYGSLPKNSLCAFRSILHCSSRVSSWRHHVPSTLMSWQHCRVRLQA